VEYGGTGWDPIRCHIFLEETQRWPAPQPLPFGANLVGPVIYSFGSDAQKSHFLPRIANLDDWWCQGFSEPGAGSDLASLKTSAVLEGDHYRVNGQKVWTTLAQHASWMFCLVRTSAAPKKQLGISFLLIDMATPGIEVRPIVTIDGGQQVNEVFLTDVMVPAANLVGEEGRGWDYTKFLLGNERAMVARGGISKQRINRIRGLAATEISEGRPLIEDRALREKLASIDVELKALEITQLRVLAAERGEGRAPGAVSSILKLRGSEIQQAVSQLMLEVAGPAAMRYLGAGDRPIDGSSPASHAAPVYFNHRKVTIYGGTSEVQKNIIAKAVLGL